MYSSCGRPRHLRNISCQKPSMRHFGTSSLKAENFNHCPCFPRLQLQLHPIPTRGLSLLVLLISPLLSLTYFLQEARKSFGPFFSRNVTLWSGCLQVLATFSRIHSMSKITFPWTMISCVS